jgi:ParB family chromosome partitioning protein
LAFPNKVRSALATLDDSEQVNGAMAGVDGMIAMAKSRRMNEDAINGLQEGRLYIAARIGELSPALPPNNRGQGRNGNKSIGRQPSDFHPDTMTDYRKLRGRQDSIADFAAKIKEINQARPDQQIAQEVSLAGFLRYLGSDGSICSKHGNSNIECYTPPEYVNLVRDVLGEIDLDPASCSKAQKTVKAKQFFTKKDDGLSQPWQGRVFLNPPYKTPCPEKFCDKLLQEFKDKSVSEAILLTNDQTDTNWWQTTVVAAAAVCFHRGRIRFLDASGEETAPTNGQTFMYFGKRVKSFIKTFASTGAILVNP